VFGPGQTAQRVGYGVCYLHAGEEKKGLLLRLGGRNEQAKVYLNGALVLRNLPAEGGTGWEPAATVNLIKGTNVLVFKVVNQRRTWRRCLELTDQDGNLVPDVQVRLAP
jgi:hypothetical protein